MSYGDDALSKNIAIVPRLALILCLVIFLAACGTSGQQKKASSSPPSIAEELYRKAEAGNPGAQYFVGLAILDAASKGDRESLAPGIDWIRKAAEQGLPMAESRMALLYMEGLGVPKDDKIAAEWLTRAASGGYDSAQYSLGLFYLQGLGVSRDPVTAHKWFKRAADQGHEKAAQALKQIAVPLDVEVRSNSTPLIRNFEQAAAAGDAMAMYNLGSVYLKGQGVAQNDAEAVKWYRKAADLGLPIAQYDLGSLYLEGKAGLGKDARTATAYLQQAADQGFAAAQASLGFVYATGQISEPDPKRAVEWFQKASLQDHVEGNYNLGLSYLNGTGVSRDISKAEQFIERAADQNHLLAQIKLMQNYIAGNILKRDLVKAYKWTAILATRNPAIQANPAVTSLLSQASSTLASEMSESQIGAGQTACRSMATGPVDKAQGQPGGLYRVRGAYNKARCISVKRARVSPASTLKRVWRRKSSFTSRMRNSAFTRIT